MTTEKVFCLLTQHGRETARVCVFGSRDSAEAALRELVETEEGVYGTCSSPLTTTDACIKFLLEHCDYVDARMGAVLLDVGPDAENELDVSEQKVA